MIQTLFFFIFYPKNQNVSSFSIKTVPACVKDRSEKPTGTCSASGGWRGLVAESLTPLEEKLHF